MILWFLCCITDVDATAVRRCSAKKHDVSDLYTAIQQHHQSDLNAITRLDVQHDCLRPRLRDYQKAAVQWMLIKEHYKSQNVAEEPHG